MKLQYNSWAFFVFIMITFGFFPVQVSAQTGPGALNLEDRLYWTAKVNAFWQELRQEESGIEQEVNYSAVARQQLDQLARMEYLLELHYGNTVERQNLASEMDRLGLMTRNPDQLAELFALLNNDPQIIGEILARPLYVESKLKTLLDMDPVDLQVVEQRAIAIRDALNEVNIGGAHVAGLQRISLDKQKLAKANLNLRQTSFPETEGFSLKQAANGDFLVGRTVLDSGERTLELVTVKRPGFRTWVEETELPESKGAKSLMPIHGALELPVITPVASNSELAVANQGRFLHTAVWTGAEMVVFGGLASNDCCPLPALSAGTRYFPVLDLWVAISTIGEPEARSSHLAVWAGTQMFIWGGEGESFVLNTGGLYDPATDSWTATDTSSIDLPTARAIRTAGWDGTEILFWGGRDDVFAAMNSGGRYVPGIDTWFPMTTGATPRFDHSSVWDPVNGALLIWGGNFGGGSITDPWRYDPIGDSWNPAFLGGDNPSARYWHTANLDAANNRWYIFGGTDGSTTNADIRYLDLATDFWVAPFATGTPPDPRSEHTAVWDSGAERLLVWGGTGIGELDTGSVYDSIFENWTSMTNTGAPSARLQHTAVWTGTEMIVFGGRTVFGAGLNTGGRYDPDVDKWVAVPLVEHQGGFPPATVELVGVNIQDGNGDGVLEPGERFNLGFTLKNNTGQIIDDLFGLLWHAETNMPADYQFTHINPVDMSLPVGDLNVGETKTFNADFKGYVGQNAPCDAIWNMSLNLNWNSGGDEIQHFVPIHLGEIQTPLSFEQEVKITNFQDSSGDAYRPAVAWNGEVFGVVYRHRDPAAGMGNGSGQGQLVFAIMDRQGNLTSPNLISSGAVDGYSPNIIWNPEKQEFVVFYVSYDGFNSYLRATFILSSENYQVFNDTSHTQTIYSTSAFVPNLEVAWNPIYKIYGMVYLEDTGGGFDTKVEVLDENASTISTFSPVSNPTELRDRPRIDVVDRGHGPDWALLVSEGTAGSPQWDLKIYTAEPGVETLVDSYSLGTARYPDLLSMKGEENLIVPGHTQIPLVGITYETRSPGGANYEMATLNFHYLYWENFFGTENFFQEQYQVASNLPAYGFSEYGTTDSGEMQMENSGVNSFMALANDGNGVKIGWVENVVSASRFLVRGHTYLAEYRTQNISAAEQLFPDFVASDFFNLQGLSMVNSGADYWLFSHHSRYLAGQDSTNNIVDFNISAVPLLHRDFWSYSAEPQAGLLVSQPLAPDAGGQFIYDPNTFFGPGLYFAYHSFVPGSGGDSSIWVSLYDQLGTQQAEEMVLCGSAADQFYLPQLFQYDAMGNNTPIFMIYQNKPDGSSSGNMSLLNLSAFYGSCATGEYLGSLNYGPGAEPAQLAPVALDQENLVVGLVDTLEICDPACSFYDSVAALRPFGQVFGSWVPAPDIILSKAGYKARNIQTVFAGQFLHVTWEEEVTPGGDVYALHKRVFDTFLVVDTPPTITPTLAEEIFPGLNRNGINGHLLAIRQPDDLFDPRDIFLVEVSRPESAPGTVPLGPSVMALTRWSDDNLNPELILDRQVIDSSGLAFEPVSLAFQHGQLFLAASILDPGVPTQNWLALKILTDRGEARGDWQFLGKGKPGFDVRNSEPTEEPSPYMVTEKTAMGLYFGEFGLGKVWWSSFLTSGASHTFQQTRVADLNFSLKYSSDWTCDLYNNNPVAIMSLNSTAPVGQNPVNATINFGESFSGDGLSSTPYPSGNPWGSEILTDEAQDSLSSFSWTLNGQPFTGASFDIPWSNLRDSFGLINPSNYGVNLVVLDSQGLSSVPSNGTLSVIDKSAPLVDVLSPNGGETLVAGTSTTISWDVSDNHAVNSSFVYYSDTPLNLFDTFETWPGDKGSWSFPHDADWADETGGSRYDGAVSAKSGTISNSQSSSMEITVSLPAAGTLRFRRRVSSESGQDFLRFFVNNVEQASWSGEQNWSEINHAIGGAGVYTIRFTYEKDGANANGDDAGWIDNLEFDHGQWNLIGLTTTLTTMNWSPLPSTVGSNYRVLVRSTDFGSNTGVDLSDANFYVVQQTTDAIDTVILYSKNRINGLYSGEGNALEAKLIQLRDNDKVNGVLLNLDNVPEVVTAYTNWDADPTNQALANAVTTAIQSYLYDENTGQVSTVYTNARYLVIAGDDRVIPFRRLNDFTALMSENTYIANVNVNSTVGSAIANNMYLSDDYLADYGGDSTIIGNNVIHLPDLSVGRLVETPDDMALTIDRFISQSGQIQLESPERLFVSGRDFFTDSSLEIRDSFSARPSYLVDSLLDMAGENPAWTKANLTAQLFGTFHALNNINGHADHYSIDADDGFVTTTDMLAQGSLPGSVLYAIGCHSGLPIAPGDPNDLDLPELFMKKEMVAYVGNTGYGWGLRPGVGYSELLMKLITEEILSKDLIALGDALSAAKRRYYLTDRRLDVFDEKVLMQATLFGLPMYSVVVKNPAIMSAPLSARDFGKVSERDGIRVEKVQVEEDLVNGLPPGVTRLELNFVFRDPTVPLNDPNSVYKQVDTADGSYFNLNGESTGEVNETIQPRFMYDSKLSGTMQHGTLFIGGQFSEVTSFTPAVAVPVSNNEDDGDPNNDSTPEPAPKLGSFVPAGRSTTLLTQSAVCEPTESTYSNLTVTTGEYRDGSVQRLFNQMEFASYYSTFCDVASPTISDPGTSAHTLSGLVASFSVDVSDAEASVHRVLVTWTDDQLSGANSTGTWQSVDLLHTSGTNDAGQTSTWSADLSLKRNIRYIIQAVDADGNVAKLLESGSDQNAEGTDYGSLYSSWKVFGVVLPDGDNDGLPDAWETANGTNPGLDDAATDLDDDGLTNLQEFDGDTHPTKQDTDGDGDNDGSEVGHSRDALDGSDGHSIAIVMTPSGDDIIIDWTADAGNMEGPYYVYRGTDPFMSPSDLIATKTLPAPAASHTDVGAMLGPTYYYWVTNVAVSTPAPNVLFVSPDNGPQIGGTSIQIFGNDFIAGSTVTIGANPCTEVVVASSASITCTTPAGTSGAKDVTVTSPNEQFGTLSGGYTYN